MTDAGTGLRHRLFDAVGQRRWRGAARAVVRALIVLPALLALPAQAASVTYTSAGSGNWTAPAGVTSVTVEAWGGGGAGGGQNQLSDGGGGGGGGAYSRKAGIPVSAGVSYPYTVGRGGGGVAGGRGGSGGDSYFKDASTVMAKGGAGGAPSTGTPPPGGAGGQAAAGVGTTKYSGGTGGTGRNSNTGRGGPGGSSAGSAASGTSGPSSWTTLTAAAPPTGGGIGGNGGDSGSGWGDDGYAPASGNGGGGGGSGEGWGMYGGDGAPGKVVITYAITATATTTAATALSATGARLNGKVSSNGASSTVSFEYGPTTAYGSTVAASPASLAASAVNAAVYADLSGLACNTTYHFRVNATNSDGTANGDDLTFTTASCPDFCTRPANIPSDVAVTCVCDTFGRANVNPSPIFGGNWVLSNSDGIGDPYINQTTGLLRLTENTLKNAKAATVPAIFPAAGNYISVEFRQHAYAGNGADGLAMILSDYSIPAVPGAYGGSLGYAQKNQAACGKTGGCPGFAGGWLGVALDEFGNYSSESEGRIGGAGFKALSVGVRGPGAAQNGYRWMGGSLGVGDIDNRASSTPAPGYMYQVIVDARKFATGTVNVNVNRDTTSKDGSDYSSLFGPFNAYGEAVTALSQGWITKLVPNYWKVSFTGATGDNTNIHEIGSLRICAQSVFPSTGGIASGFSAIDEAYPGAPPRFEYFQTGHIFMKVAGKPFSLWVGALTNAPASGLSTGYAAVQEKYAQVKFVDNSDNACGSDAKRTCDSKCTGKAAVEAGASQVATFAQGSLTGAVLSPSFTLNSAHPNLVAVIRECTSAACSTFTSTAAACSPDSFSVRPQSIAAVVSSQTPGGTDNAATNAGTSGTPVFRAGNDPFALTATTIAGYTGVPKINGAAVSAVSPATIAGSLTGEFPAATSGTPSTATGIGFKYSEAGAFYLRGKASTDKTQETPAVYDDTWTTVDSGDDGDCVGGNSTAAYSNALNSEGKYGCNFGLAADTGGFGRFIPNEFRVSGAVFTNRQVATSAAGAAASAFSYLDEAMGLAFTLEAWSGSGNITRNYSGDLAKLDLSSAKAFASLVFGAAVPSPLPALTPPFAALTPRLSATGFSGTWPASDATGAGTIALSGTLAVSSLNTPTDNRVKPDGPFVGAAIGIAPQDSDGVRILAYDLDTDNSGGATGADRLKLASTTLYFGQLRLLPAIGSELLPLAMRAQVQRWNGSAFVANGDDNSTRIPLANLLLSGWKANLNAGETCHIDLGSDKTKCLSSGDLSVAKGSATIGLSAPGKGNNGSVRVTACLVADADACKTANAGLPYLAGPWRGAAKFDQNPAATAAFGLYKGAGQIIYFRENY